MVAKTENWVDGVGSHQDKNGKHPHDKNAGIVFLYWLFSIHLQKGDNVREAISHNLLIILISMRTIS